MDSLKAFAMGEANRGKKLKVFDWNKAARLIKEHNAKNASAGLSGDCEYTGGEILENGKPLNKDNTYVYLASTWATPELEINGERYDCFIMEDEVPKGWDKKDLAHLIWPASAIKILKEK